MTAIISGPSALSDRLGLGAVGLMGAAIAGRQAINAIRGGEVKGRRQSIPTYRSEDPGAFWFHISMLTLFALGMLVFSALAFGLFGTKQ
jgi:hypothetical protein